MFEPAQNRRLSFAEYAVPDQHLVEDCKSALRRAGYHIVAIALIAFALVMAGVAMEAAKDNQNAEATVILRQP